LKSSPESKCLFRLKSAPFAKRNSSSNPTSPASPTAAPNAQRNQWRRSQAVTSPPTGCPPTNAGPPKKPTKPAARQCATSSTARTARAASTQTISCRAPPTPPPQDPEAPSRDGFPPPHRTEETRVPRSPESATDLSNPQLEPRFVDRDGQ